MHIRNFLACFWLAGLLELNFCYKIDLGKLTCQSNGKYVVDNTMRLTYRKCPANTAVHVNWASINPNNANEMWEMGGMFMERYKCLFRLYKAIQFDGHIKGRAAARYAKVFHPRAASRYMRRHILECATEYNIFYKSSRVICNKSQVWTQLSACIYTAELRACNYTGYGDDGSIEYWDDDINENSG